MEGAPVLLGGLPRITSRLCFGLRSVGYSMLGSLAGSVICALRGANPSTSQGGKVFLDDVSQDIHMTTQVASMLAWSYYTPPKDRDFKHYLFLLSFLFGHGVLLTMRRKKTAFARHLKSRTIKAFCHEPLLSPETIRQLFNDMPFTEKVTPLAHTHGAAAADRSSSSVFIDRFGPAFGAQSFFYQCSRADERNGRLGSRSFYWAKDLNTEPQPIKIPKNPLVAMVDVDQYVDMHSFLTSYVHPTILYTFQPDSAAKVSNEYSYTFNADNTTQYFVTGGAKYVAPVWNYSTDHLVVQSQFCGIPIVTAAYSVDRRATSPDHELILLTPLGWWGPLGSFFYTRWMSGHVLSRLEPVTSEGFVRLMSSSQSGVKISTGAVGSFNSATIPAVVDDTIAAIARTSRYDLTMPQVQGFVEGDRSQAAALLEYHRSLVKFKPPVVCPVPDAVRRYQFHPVKFDTEAKSSLVAFMSPFVHGAFSPDRSLGNEVQSAIGRVISVKPPELLMTGFLAKVMEEFAMLLISDDFYQQLDPVDFDTVLDRQPRPSQRRILSDSECMLPNRRIDMFQKREAYQNVKDPRAICMINGVDKREYSAFLYAFDEVMKRQSWYAFGKTPFEISQQVVRVCSKASNVGKTDFSRFDGHGSNLMRELERSVLVRAFRPCHHSKLLELHRSQFGLTVYGRFGVKYEQDFVRASGSPETSDFNSLTNGFVAYLAKRMTRVNGCFMTPQEAWNSLGLYGGDDGLTPDVDVKTYVRAARAIGQEIVVDPIHRGKFGVQFLSRIYSQFVWFGDTTSCCDIPRLLSKFHTTVVLPDSIKPVDKLLEKVRSIALSDLETPIIGQFCKAVILLNGGGEIKANDACSRITQWISKYPREVQYDNTSSPWMYDYCQLVLPDFDIKGYERWLSTLKTLDDCLKPPMFLEPPLAVSKEPVVVDGTIIPYDTKLSGASLPVPTSDQQILSAVKKASFARMKAEKIAAGTWVEKAKRSEVAIDPEFIAWRRRKMARAIRV